MLSDYCVQYPGDAIRSAGAQPRAGALPVHRPAGVAHPARQDPRALHHH